VPPNLVHGIVEVRAVRLVVNSFHFLGGSSISIHVEDERAIAEPRRDACTMDRHAQPCSCSCNKSVTLHCRHAGCRLNDAKLAMCSRPLAAHWGGLVSTPSMVVVRIPALE
jgi:hypothetical protein